MKCFESVPNLEIQLTQVSERTKAIAHDTLLRQPISEMLDRVFATEGKQMRSALLLIFGRTGEKYPDCQEQLLTAGAIVEMTHMASLIHDDIVDDSPLRRGRPTLQSFYGKDMAVYGGDYLLSQVLMQLMRQDMLESGQVLAKSIADMCSGELGQYYSRFNTEVKENQYFMNISGKTAALFSAACEMGALISESNRQNINAASRFGHSLGILYQLRDDLADLAPNDGTDNKKHGMDFKNGIYTLPIIYTFNDAKYGSALKKLAEDADKIPEALLEKELNSLIGQSGGIEYAEWIMKQYKGRAVNSIAQITSANVREYLTAVVDELLDF
jgi:heptaprenyl diphosphate synthase